MDQHDYDIRGRESREGDGHGYANGTGMIPTATRGYSMDEGPSSPPKRPDPVHSSSSTSNSAYSQRSQALGSMQFNNAGTSPLIESRPSLADTRRISSGVGVGGSSLGHGNYRDRDDAVPIGFDEGILRGLCELDGSLPLLADRIKQSIASCKQVAVFFRSRAEIEEKYARSLTELVRTTGDVYGRADCKAGTFVSAYQQSLKLQEHLATNRIRFSNRLNEMSDELLSLAREGEKMRKLHKENGNRYQSALQESEAVTEKCKSRFDGTAEELERLLVSKEGESFKDAGMRSANQNHSNNSVGGASMGSGTGGGKRALGKAMTKGGLLFKGKAGGSIQKQEEDIRNRMAVASDSFRKSVLESQGLRQEYFNFQLPKVLRMLKEVADEIDMGTQYHLTRFAFLYESTVVGEGTVLNPMGAPDEGPGLKGIFEAIDNRTDFKSYMQNYAVARGTPKGPRREGPYDEGFLPPLPPHVQKSMESNGGSNNGINTFQTPTQSVSTRSAPSSDPSRAGDVNATPGGSNSQEQYVVPGIPASTGHTFGVDLAEQLIRDGTEIPLVLLKCAEAIETFGIENMGIYRLSGTTSRVQALKHALDKDIHGTDVMSPDWTGDINVVSGALKLWLRELPEPLLTYGLYNDFIEAARYDNERLRYIRLHGQVNALPDANYATLKFFMGHLDRIRRLESKNQMSISNLSIVFGPTLLGAPPEEGGMNLEHMSFQCRAIETILDKYGEIFVDEEDGGAQAAAESQEFEEGVGGVGGEQESQDPVTPEHQISVGYAGRAGHAGQTGHSGDSQSQSHSHSHSPAHSNEQQQPQQPQQQPHNDPRAAVGQGQMT